MAAKDIADEAYVRALEKDGGTLLVPMLSARDMRWKS